MAIDPTGGLATLAFFGGIVILVVMWLIYDAPMVVKFQKAMKKAAVLFVVIVISGAALGGLAIIGVPSLLASQGPAPSGGSTGAAGGIYSVIIGSSTAFVIKAGQTAPTQYIDITGHAYTAYAPNALWVGASSVSYVYSFSLVTTVQNGNTGSTQVSYAFAGSMTAVPNVLVTGIPTPIVNYTADQSRFAITWTMSGTGSPGALQSGAAVTAGFTANQVGTLTVAVPLATGVIVNFAKTAKVEIDFAEGGVPLSCVFYNTG